jgi:hypothetical protein
VSTRFVASPRSKRLAALPLLWRVLASRNSVFATNPAAGFVLPFVIALAAALMLAAAMLVTMGNTGIFGAFSQSRTKDARQAAEQGVDVIINTLNASPNRKLLVADVPINNWSDPAYISKLRNPCNQASQVNPTSAALQLGNNQEVPIAGDSKKTFVLKTVTLRNPKRLATFVSSSSSSGPGGIAGLSTNGYSETAIKLDNTSTSADYGYIEVVVEGRIYDGNNKLQSTAQVTREFAVIPKCCGIGFSGPYGNETQTDCRPPMLVVGLNGGGLTIPAAAPTPELFQTSSDISLTTIATKNDDLLVCLNTAATCSTQNNLSNAATVKNLGQLAPAVPSYPCPANTNCSTNYAISSKPPSTNAIPPSIRDYIRVAGTAGNEFVEFCNVPVTPADQTNPSFPTSASNCDSSDAAASSKINDFCVRVDSTSPTAGPTFYCRISTIEIYDQAFSTSYNSQISNRRQNNTLWIDTTRGSIYFYVYGTATNAINLFDPIYPFADGQIQHVNCQNTDGTIPASYVDVCSQAALPQAFARAMIYSNNNINLRVGDDGFIRDMRVYLPRGTVTFDYPPGTSGSCIPPDPLFRGILWTDNLVYNRPTLTNCSNTASRNTLRLVVPPTGTVITSSIFQLPPPIEWVARGSTYTSLF